MYRRVWTSLHALLQRISALLASKANENKIKPVATNDASKIAQAPSESGCATCLSAWSGKLNRKSPNSEVEVNMQ